MTPRHYDRMWALFDEIQKCEPGRRGQVLDERCATEPDLRAELEKLLAQADQGQTDLLGEPCPAAVKGQLGEPCPDPLLGRRVGAYEVRERVAAGGMGCVYLAVRREDYEQRVAVKVIRRGLGAADVLRRFRAERQVLARLSHPNIARLLDGGSLDGSPYFVMEFVDGVPIDLYCAGRKLAVPEILRLFATVCSAVQYAHQNLVLHRDLKPGNVLIDASDAPKLVDFGIAKVLDPDAPEAADATTQTGGHFATPEYASPEQLRGDAPPGTACDVYALGVILYELLTGRRPFERGGGSAYELVRRVCEEEPAGPRRHRPGLPRDLDVICRKCLRKEPGQRFATAADLADEVRRVLAGEPIRSRPTGAAERALKWCRRRPATAALAACMAAVVVTALLAVSWQNRRLATSNRRAEAADRVVSALMGDLIAVLGDDGRNTPPDVSARQLDVIQVRVSASMDEHRRELDANPRMRQRYGQILARLAEQDYLLARDAQAGDGFGRALELQRDLLAAFPDEPDYKHDLAETLYGFSLLRRRARATEEAAGLNREALRLRRELAAARPEVASFREELARDLHQAADLRKDLWAKSPPPGELAEVEEAYREGREILEKLVEERPGEPRYQLMLAANFHSWGHALSRAGAEHYARSRAMYDEAAVRFDRLIAKEAAAPDYRHEKARLFSSMSVLAEKRSERASAIELCRRAVDLESPLVEEYPAVVKYRFELARHLTRLGDLLWRDRPGEGANAYGRALQERRRLRDLAPWRASYHGDLGLLLARVAERTPPAAPAAVRDLLTEADGCLRRAIEAGADQPAYAEARQRVRRRLDL